MCKQIRDIEPLEKCIRSPIKGAKLFGIPTPWHSHAISGDFYKNFI